MTTSDDLDRLRHELPRCAGIAWFTGAPLQLVAASGEADDAAWPSWEWLARAAPALLREGPVVSPEVLVRWPEAMVLLAERETGVVAVVMRVALTGQAHAGLAVVQARMVAAQVGA